MHRLHRLARVLAVPASHLQAGPAQTSSLLLGVHKMQDRLAHVLVFKALQQHRALASMLCPTALTE